MKVNGWMEVKISYYWNVHEQLLFGTKRRTLRHIRKSSTNDLDLWMTLSEGILEQTLVVNIRLFFNNKKQYDGSKTREELQVNCIEAKLTKNIIFLRFLCVNLPCIEESVG